MPKLSLHRRTYLALCVLACGTPLALDFGQFALGVSPSSPAVNDILLAAIGNLAASLLTYPAGLLGTIAVFVLTSSGLVTATEAMLLAAPLYIGAGYYQWYVLIPRHFSSKPG